LAPAVVEAQAAPCVQARDVSWIPARPLPGTAFEVLLRSVTMEQARVALRVTLGDVPLVPLRARGDTVRLLAAVPIDSVQGTVLRVTCTDAAAAPYTSPYTVRVHVEAGRYRLEALRVAPKFSAPPDSALAARLESEASRGAAVARAALETPMLWRDPFLAPRPSRITSGFGNGRTFNGEVLSRHMGTDYAGAVGTPVTATNRGVVRLTGAFHLGGNVVYLDHGAGVSTAYLHLSRILVSEGDTVARGARIGLVGATGRVTGPHLHFITRVGGVTVDPRSLVGRR